MAIRTADIIRTMRPFLEESNGYTYLPANKVNAAMDAISSKYVGLSAYVKESKAGFKRFYVDRLGTKRIMKAFEAVIREE